MSCWEFHMSNRFIIMVNFHMSLCSYCQFDSLWYPIIQSAYVDGVPFEFADEISLWRELYNL